MANMKRPYAVVAAFLIAAIAVGGVALFMGVLSPHPTIALDTFNLEYGTKGTRLDTCTTCHTRGRFLNPYGYDLRAKFPRELGAEQRTEEQKVEAFRAVLRSISELDSDSDGYSNIEEILARTFPGDAKDHSAGR